MRTKYHNLIISKHQDTHTWAESWLCDTCSAFRREAQEQVTEQYLWIFFINWPRIWRTLYPLQLTQNLILSRFLASSIPLKEFCFLLLQTNLINVCYQRKVREAGGMGTSLQEGPQILISCDSCLCSPLSHCVRVGLKEKQCPESDGAWLLRLVLHLALALLFQVTLSRWSQLIGHEDICIDLRHGPRGLLPNSQNQLSHLYIHWSFPTSFHTTLY